MLSSGVTKVEFDLDGQPNAYNIRMRCYHSTFCRQLSLVQCLLGAEAGVTRPSKFFTSSYAIFVYLRAARDHKVHVDGCQATGAGRNIHFCIHRTASGSGNCHCHVFILSDAVF